MHLLFKFHATAAHVCVLMSVVPRGVRSVCVWARGSVTCGGVCYWTGGSIHPQARPRGSQLGPEAQSREVGGRVS